TVPPTASSDRWHRQTGPLRRRLAWGRFVLRSYNRKLLEKRRRESMSRQLRLWFLMMGMMTGCTHPCRQPGCATAPPGAAFPAPGFVAPPAPAGLAPPGSTPVPAIPAPAPVQTDVRSFSPLPSAPSPSPSWQPLGPAHVQLGAPIPDTKEHQAARPPFPPPEI